MIGCGEILDAATNETFLTPYLASAVSFVTAEGLDKSGPCQFEVLITRPQAA